MNPLLMTLDSPLLWRTLTTKPHATSLQPETFVFKDAVNKLYPTQVIGSNRGIFHHYLDGNSVLQGVN